MKTKKPIILHTIDSLSVGGAEILLTNTIKLLPEFDHIIVYLFKQNELKPSLIENGVELICLEYKGWSNMLSAVLKFKRIIQEKKPFLVHSHLFYSTICARLAVPSTLPLVSTLHSLYSKDAFEKNSKSIWAERFLLRKRYALIAVSKNVLNDYINYVPFKGKRFVLYNFLPDSNFYRRKGRQDNDLKCVAIGNLKEAKNYPFLLDIFSALKNSGISLDIYGEGLLRNQLQNQIDREGLPVKLCGQTNSIIGVLAQYDLFIQASSHEGFGISVIEAMGASMPVFVSDIPVFREITGANAFFFSLSNPNTAADNLKFLKDNAMLRNQHVQQAYDYCRQHYSENTYKEKLQQIYNVVTSDSQSQSK